MKRPASRQHEIGSLHRRLRQVVRQAEYRKVSGLKPTEAQLAEITRLKAGIKQQEEVQAQIELQQFEEAA
jgi:hypothetical protein